MNKNDSVKRKDVEKYELFEKETDFENKFEQVKIVESEKNWEFENSEDPEKVELLVNFDEGEKVFDNIIGSAVFSPAQMPRLTWIKLYFVKCIVPR